jgi:hypothetical protein
MAAFWKRAPRAPALLMEMAPKSATANAWAGIIMASRRSNSSFNRACLASKLLTREGLRVEAIAGFSRGQEDHD